MIFTKVGQKFPSNIFFYSFVDSLSSCGGQLRFSSLHLLSLADTHLEWGKQKINRI